MQYYYYHPAITIFLSAFQNAALRRWVTTSSHNNASNPPLFSKYVLPLVISTLLWKLLPPHSFVAAFWHHLTVILTKLLPSLLAIVSSASSSDNDDHRHNGPLGPNYDKPIQVISGIVMWKICRSRLPPIYLLAATAGADGESSSSSSSSSSLWQQYKWPSPIQWVAVSVLSVGVNLVLLLWSKSCKSKGNHAGVERMVRTKMNRKLSLAEHIHMMVLALLNAICEEVTSRGLWRLEFQQSTSAGLNLWQSNLCQAVVFGVWHYNGIPSGITGVCLTTVYGFIMGLLADYNDGGLLMPIATHTIADYFIFTYIARQQISSSSSKEK